MRRVYFYRDVREFAGGHLKVWDYFCHTNAAPGYRAQVYLTDASRCDEANPWSTTPAPLESWQPERADVLFVAGLDWNAVPRSLPAVIPVVSLVQGLGHADPADPRNQFLERPAIRICVSNEVRDALRVTGRVRGPLLCIPNGVAIPDGIDASAERSTRVFIGGIKNPKLAGEIAVELRRHGIDAAVLTSELPRAEFLAAVAGAQIAVVLPLAREGFFLPALEAMALGTLVVCPDCVGNRSVCLPGENCFRPPYTLDDIVRDVRHALSLPASERRRLLANARKTALAHTLDVERAAYHAKVLRPLDDLWREAIAG